MDKNKLLSLSLFVLSLIFIYFYGGKIPYMLFYFALLLPCVSFLYALAVFLRFKFNQELDRHFVTKGEQVNFKFSIHNEDFFFYPYIKVKFCNSDMIFTDQFQEKNLSLLPYTSKHFYFNLNCRYRGCYTIGIDYIDIEDFTGAFKLRYKIKNHFSITVFPKVIQLDRFFINTSFLSEAQSNIDMNHEDYTTVSDIRTYSYGDSIRRIHWKLSSKLARLMVKKYQSTTESNAVIILDLSSPDFPPSTNLIIEDKLIEATVAVINYCLSNWMQINFIYYDDSIKNIEARTPADFSGILDFLSKVEFKSKVQLCDILKVHINQNLSKTNLVIFTSKLSYDIYSEVFNSKLAGHELSMVFVSPEELTGTKYPDQDQILSSLHENNISIYKVNISDNTKNVLERLN